MADRRTVDELSIQELEQILATRRRQERLRRLRRIQEDGRLVGVPPAERPTPPPIPLPHVSPTGATVRYQSTAPADPVTESNPKPARVRLRIPTINLRWVGNQLLLFVEIAAILGLVYLIWDTWQTRQELNREVTQVQQEIIEESYPTPEPTPLINPVLLPGGHTSPIAANGGQPGEAGGIPEHLLPLVNAYQPPPIPTPGPEHPRRIVIPAIGVDHPIVEGDTPEQLKKGVGHHVGSANPGQAGNLVLTAHNDIYGEIFRYLSDLHVGDKVIVHTLSRQYVYTVQAQRIVDPTQVSVLASTRQPTITLISCYPYLVDTQRIVIIGILEEEL